MMNLTIEDAQLIRKWRADGGSWRWIARKAAIQWPERQYCAGNQIEGMYLCGEAAKLLNEDSNEKPWN